MEEIRPLSELLTIMALPLLAILGIQGQEPEDESPEEASQITWLRSLGDREALFQIMEAGRQVTHGLEAAEALAELGDVRGLDHLIAALKSPNSSLRHQAAQILKRLNHPRGLRALTNHAAESQPSTRGARREQLYEDLSATTTDELVAMWHEAVPTQRSALDSEVIEAILLERLGRLPRLDDGGGQGERLDIDDDVDPKVQRLWRLGDTDGLLRIFQGEPGASLQLQAAEALADLGDERALDFLIGLLDEPNEAHSDMAAEMLDWLDLPRGNAALRAWGLEFETDAGSTLGGTDPDSPAADPQTEVPRVTPDSWVAGQPVPSRPGAPHVPLWQAVGAQSPWEQQETASRTSAAAALAGAVGGVLGFMVFRLGLHLLGLLPLPQSPADWLGTSALHFLLASVIVGAAFGAPGSRVAQALAMHRNQEIVEGDPAPAIGALLAGATLALVTDVLLFFFFGL